jgi:hypothetical protein
MSTINPIVILKSGSDGRKNGECDSVALVSYQCVHRISKTCTIMKLPSASGKIMCNATTIAHASMYMLLEVSYPHPAWT